MLNAKWLIYRRLILTFKEASLAELIDEGLVIGVSKAASIRLQVVHFFMTLIMSFKLYLLAAAKFDIIMSPYLDSR